MTELTTGEGLTPSTAVGLSVPPAMLEPAQALDAATGTGVSQAANAVATATFHQNIIVSQRRTGPGFLTRAVWYLFIGWWLTGLAIGFAWLCSLSVVLLPVAYLIVNKIPTILTLRPRSIETDVAVDAMETSGLRPVARGNSRSGSVLCGFSSLAGGPVASLWPLPMSCA